VRSTESSFQQPAGLSVLPVSQNVSQTFLCSCLQCRSIGSIERRSDNVEIGMLILHRCSYIAMPHRLHHRREIASISEHPGSIVMPTVHDQFLRVELFSEQAGIACPDPSNAQTPTSSTETTNPGLSRRRESEAVHTHDHSSESFSVPPPSCCLVRK
jgi:hypothetical protein